MTTVYDIVAKGVTSEGFSTHTMYPLVKIYPNQSKKEIHFTWRLLAPTKNSSGIHKITWFDLPCNKCNKKEELVETIKWNMTLDFQQYTRNNQDVTTNNFTFIFYTGKVLHNLRVNVTESKWLKKWREIVFRKYFFMKFLQIDHGIFSS